MKILITGPESTAKSTIAKELAFEYNWVYLPEYARKYLDHLNKAYDFEDLEIIARAHFNQYLGMMTIPNIIFDTFLFNIKIWSEYKYKKCADWILENRREVNFDVILLMYPDIVWEEDPLRESKTNRLEVFHLFEQEFAASGINYEVIKGNGEERIDNCRKLINNLLSISE